jgi:hypothetical protein
VAPPDASSGGGGSDSGGAAAAATVYFCALGYGNLAALANDPRIAPDGEGPAAEAAVAEANAALVVAWAGPVPVPLLLCVRPINACGEVLLDYGGAYFSAWRMLRVASQRV